MNIFSAGVIDAYGDIYPGGLEPGTVIYTADQLAAVVQQRDELVAAAKVALEAMESTGMFPASQYKLQAAIAKVQP